MQMNNIVRSTVTDVTPDPDGHCHKSSCWLFLFSGLFTGLTHNITELKGNLGRVSYDSRT